MLLFISELLIYMMCMVRCTCEMLRVDVSHDGSEFHVGWWLVGHSYDGAPGMPCAGLQLDDGATVDSVVNQVVTSLFMYRCSPCRNSAD